MHAWKHAHMDDAHSLSNEINVFIKKIYKSKQIHDQSLYIYI